MPVVPPRNASGESGTLLCRLLTLLTDFGLRDGYVGMMKGAIARIDPTLHVIDLTHEIPPQDIAAARFVLMSSVSYFPKGTIHVAVVDPGVGSSRRAVAVRFAGGILVGPDNGLLSGVLSQTPVLEAVTLTNSQYWGNPRPSSTFHGRDIFAPVAAHLAMGVPLTELGKPIPPETLVQLPLPACIQSRDLSTGRDVVQGCIQAIDHFGNLITTIPGSLVQEPWSVKIGTMVLPGCRTYADGDVDHPLALVGSHGWVEVAVNRGNAQTRLKLDYGSPVTVILGNSPSTREGQE